MIEEFLQLALSHLTLPQYKHFDDGTKRVIATRAAELFELSNDVSEKKFNRVRVPTAYSHVKDRVGTTVATEDIITFSRQHGIPLRSITLSIRGTFMGMYRMKANRVKTPAELKAVIATHSQPGFVRGGEKSNTLDMKDIIQAQEKGK